jgi:hypothetical protein
MTTRDLALEAELVEASRTNLEARLVLADYWFEHGRPDIGALWYGPLPEPTGIRDVSEISSMVSDTELDQVSALAREWANYGLSTEPADRDLFTAAVYAMYWYQGILPCPKIIWCASPVEVLLAPMQPEWRDLNRKLKDLILQLWNVRWEAWKLNIVTNTYWNEIEIRMEHGLAAMSRVDSLVAYELGRTGPHARGLDAWAAERGQFDADRAAPIMACLDVLKIRVEPLIEFQLRALTATCKSASYWRPGQKYIFVSERPTKPSNRPDLLLAWPGFGVPQQRT